MPSKPQSPGPNPTTSPPKLARSRKVVVGENTTGRAGSAGGIVLEQVQKPNMSSKPATKATATPPPVKDAVAAAGPNRQRRRPRKLNKEPTSQAPNSTSTPLATTTTTPKSAAPAPAPTAIKADIPPSTSNSELEALKTRIRSLEAKVEQLYNTTARSPRRRGKGRKNSSATTVPELSRSNTAETSRVEEIEEDEEEADEELVRLEGELEIARQDLEAYRPTRRRARRSTSGLDYDEDEVEEITRDFDDGAGSTQTMNREGKQVTLSGNYRIPLPASVSMTDVKNIQSGVSAAQNVAKSFLEQRRAQAKLNPQPAKTAASAKGKAAASTAVSTEMSTGSEGGKSWGEWFGGYSVAITRAVKNIEAEAALETQRPAARRPAQPGRTSSGKSAVVKPTTTKTNAGAVMKAGNRPSLKPRAGNLSSEQLQGLMK